MARPQGLLHRAPRRPDTEADMGRSPKRIAFVLVLLSVVLPMAVGTAVCARVRPASGHSRYHGTGCGFEWARRRESPAGRRVRGRPCRPCRTRCARVLRRSMRSAPIRVIVMLEGAPARRLEREARAQEAPALQSLDTRVRAEVVRQSRRDPASAPLRDAERHAELRRRAPADRAALRPLAEEREQIELRIQRVKAQGLRAALAPEHARVAAALRSLGGKGVRSLWVANALVVSLPAGRLDDAAAIRGVARALRGRARDGASHERRRGHARQHARRALGRRRHRRHVRPRDHRQWRRSHEPASGRCHGLHELLGRLTRGGTERLQLGRRPRRG